MHLGLTNRPFVPHVKSWEPCYFTEVPDGPQIYALNILRLQEKGTQILFSYSMFCRQCNTFLYQNMR
jgi:hypothetical protein